jgi:uncharacterized membrane protein YgcG
MKGKVKSILKNGVSLVAGGAMLIGTGCATMDNTKRPYCEKYLELAGYSATKEGVMNYESLMDVYAQLRKTPNLQTFVIKAPRGDFNSDGKIVGIYFDKTGDSRNFISSPEEGTYRISDLEEFQKLKGKVSEEAEWAKVEQILKGMERDHRRNYNDFQLVAEKCTAKGTYSTLKEIIDLPNILGLLITYDSRDIILDGLDKCRYSVTPKITRDSGGSGGASGGGSSGGGGSGAGSR